MQIANKTKSTRSEIKDDLKYWADKKAHFIKAGNKDGIKVANLMLNKYLDSLLSLSTGK